MVHTVFGSLQKIAQYEFIIHASTVNNKVIQIYVDYVYDSDTLTWVVDDCGCGYYSFAYQINHDLNVYRGTKLYHHELVVDGETFECVCPVADKFNEHPEKTKPYYLGYCTTNGTIAYLTFSTPNLSIIDYDGNTISSDDIDNCTDDVTSI